MPNFFSSCMLSLRKKNPFIFLSDLLIAQIQSIKTGLWTTLSLRLNHRCFMLLSHFLILNHIRKQNTHTFWYPPKYPPSILWLFRLVLCHLAHVSPSVTISRKSHPRPIKFTLIFTTSLQHNNTLQNKCMLISRWRKAKRTVHTKKLTSISTKHKRCLM